MNKLLEKLSKAELTAVQVLHAFQNKALKVTDELNAVTEFLPTAEDFSQCLDKLPASYRRPLHGLPFSVKECFFVKGCQTTCGYSQYLGKSVGYETAPIIQFMESLGAVLFAKTNLPQGCFSFDSRNPVYGITKNAVDKTKSPGGSTSGEGALVGSGGSLVGIGTDAGGSVRVPAAWNGNFCLKPSSRRTLQGGEFEDHYLKAIISKEYFSFGFMTRDAESLVTLHRLLYSEQTFQRFPSNTMVPLPFNEDLFASKEPLNIAYCDFDGVIQLVPGMKRALYEAKHKLERQGHHLIEWKNVALLKEMYLAYCSTLLIDGAVDLIKALQGDVEISYPNKETYQLFVMPDWLKTVVKPIARWLQGDLVGELFDTVCRGRNPHDLNLCFREMEKCREKFRKEFAELKLNALLWPAMPCPALPLDVPREVSTALSYLCLFNFLDWPAGVCPFGKYTEEDAGKARDEYPELDVYHKVIKKHAGETTSVGLPLAVQIAAPQFKEETVLRLLKELS